MLSKEEFEIIIDFFLESQRFQEELTIQEVDYIYFLSIRLIRIKLEEKVDINMSFLFLENIRNWSQKILKKHKNVERYKKNILDF